MNGQMGKENIAEALHREHALDYTVTATLHLRALGAPRRSRRSTEKRGSRDGSHRVSGI